MSNQTPKCEDLLVSYSGLAADLILGLPDEDHKKLLSSLRGSVKNITKKILEINQYYDVKKRVLGSHSDEVDKKKIFKILQEEYGKSILNINEKLENHMGYKAFEDQIQELIGDGDIIIGEDPDVEMSGGKSMVDPITKKKMVDPVKIVACGHTVERKSIVDLLEINKRTRCPVIGCGNKRYVELENLVPDIAMILQLKKSTSQN
ncbi:E3 SUMO-protein ligase NSE2-like [Prorops nasuta]|uniref:E3 SUMO-protein ligase NSE2-like n=1 Tax=Prorops nasuta TaxID=863751 RepID=UPI0034CDFD13